MSKQFTTMSVEHRKDKKIESVKQLRKMNYIPAIVFGDNKESESIKITAKNWKILSETKELIFSIVAGDKKELVSLAAVERGAFGSPLHLSLSRVTRNVLTEVMLPVKLIGERKSSEKSLVQQHLSEVKIEAIPTNIPHSVEVDITDIVEGDIIRVSDLKLPEGVKTKKEDANEVVLECHAQHLQEEAAAEQVVTEQAPEKKPE